MRATVLEPARGDEGAQRLLDGTIGQPRASLQRLELRPGQTLRPRALPQDQPHQALRRGQRRPFDRPVELVEGERAGAAPPSVELLENLREALVVQAREALDQVGSQGHDGAS